MCANKAKQTVEVGMHSWEHRLPAETSEADLAGARRRAQRRPGVHGILVQLPLPQAYRCGQRSEAIDPDKDVDGFHPVNVGRLLRPASARSCPARRRVGDAWRSACDPARRASTRSSSAGPTSSASRWRAPARARTAPSPSRIRGPAISPTLCRRADLLVAAVGQARNGQGATGSSRARP